MLHTLSRITAMASTGTPAQGSQAAVRQPIRRVAFIAAYALAAAAIAPGESAAQTSTCMGPDDSTGTMLIEALRYTATGTDANSVRIRQRIGIPQLASTDIALVTDERTCQKAVSTLSTQQGNTTAGRRVYVLRVGRTRYAVFDPGGYSDNVAQWKPMWLYDSKWVFVGTHSV